MTEVWRDVPGYEGLYEISDQGRARTWWLTKRYPNVTEPKVLSPAPSGSDYLFVGLVNEDRVRRNGYLHQLVCAAFIGPRPEGMECCHNNGIRTDNRKINLRYDTHANNGADRLRHGTHTRGERHPLSRLTWDQVTLMRHLRSEGTPVKQLAARFSASEGHVYGILSGERWKIPPELEEQVNQDDTTKREAQVDAAVASDNLPDFLK